MNILVTGGLGYIGSHTCVALLESGHNVIVVDDVSNSDASIVGKIQKAAGLAERQYNRLTLVEGDVRDTALLSQTMRKQSIDAVIHFAAKKAVGESVEKPALYYDVNVGGLLSVLRAMAQSAVSKIIFSSSATVYGDATPPFEETMSTSGCNPYGWSKVMCEHILIDSAQAGSNWAQGFTDCQSAQPLGVSILRYFNPLGAHKSYLLGENPKGIPNNLLPYIVQTALGIRQKLSVFGSDYPTRDGTCERDYIHVCDVAQGHLLALSKLSDGVNVYNLGSGKGSTVLEVLSAFEKATGVKIPFEMAPRRAGDVAVSYANAQKARRELGFETQYTLMDMCRDHYLAAKAMSQR